MPPLHALPALTSSPSITDAARGSATPVSMEDLVTPHLALVAHIVRETMGRLPGHVDRDDLNSAGLTALVTAARSWDPERGIPFAGYAARRVRGAILDELRSVDWASRSVRRRAREIETTRHSLAGRMRKVPDDAQVATELGITLAEIQRCDEDLARAAVLSLDAGTAQHDSPMADLMPDAGPVPEAVIEQREQLQYLSEAIDELPERLRAVVRGYFLDERPMASIAAELGVTESRISQLRAEALTMLRGALDSALDPDQVARHPRAGGAAARRRDTYFRAVAERHSAHGYRGAAAGRSSGASALDSTA